MVPAGIWKADNNSGRVKRVGLALTAADLREVVTLPRLGRVFGAIELLPLLQNHK